MDTLLKTPYKMHTALLLTLLISVLLINNTVAHRNFDRVKTSVTAIYNDRLMAATYIFEMADHLYQERIITQQLPGAVQPELSLLQHQEALQALIGKYEATRLTKAEKQHWIAFKNQLTAYRSAGAGSSAATAHFQQTLNELKSLTAIQTGEGDQLFRNTTATVSMAGLYAYLEFALAILIGVIAIVLISISKKTFVPSPRYPSHN